LFGAYLLDLDITVGLLAHTGPQSGLLLSRRQDCSPLSWTVTVITSTNEIFRGHYSWLTRE